MKSENLQVDPSAEEIIKGINKALRKLIEENAARNKSLIVADKDGNPVNVPAKELLKSLKP